MEHGDIDAVLHLFDRVAEERVWIGTEPGYDREKYRDIFGYGISRGLGMFVALEDDALTGMLTTYRHGEYGYTLGMMVAPAHRGRGIGRALLERLFAWSREHKIDRLSLLVFPHNDAALALYRSTGFVEVDRYINDVSRKNGEVWDTILMQKDLA